ncbi:hypothetical protein LCGC14_1887790, partial [marine sediment metagenome]
MTNGVVGQTPTAYGSGATPPLRLSKRAELLSAPWLWQLAAEGRV